MRYQAPITLAISASMIRFIPFLMIVLLIAVGILTFRAQITTQLAAWHGRHAVNQNELLSDAYVGRILNSSGQFDAAAQKAVWFDKEIPLPESDLADRIQQTLPGPEAIPSQEKWIEIDLTNQALYAREGDKLIYAFKISSGTPWTPTITGEFHIWAKLLSQRMSGGSHADGTFYDLPNVPFVQYFHEGYGIHGAYWHTDFGKPRSHGCINLSIDNAQKLFAWTDPALGEGESADFTIDPSESTRVVVHGTTPAFTY